MTVNAAIIISLVTLIVVVIGHIFVMARWSGKVDARLEEILRQPGMWTTDLTNAANALRAEQAAAVSSLRGELSIYAKETEALRTARHQADGILQRHEGQLTAISRTIDRCEKWIDAHSGENGRG